MTEQHESNRLSCSNKGSLFESSHLIPFIDPKPPTSVPSSVTFHERISNRTQKSLTVILLHLQIALSYHFIGSSLIVPEIQHGLRERGYMRRPCRSCALRISPGQCPGVIARPDSFGRWPAVQLFPSVPIRFCADSKLTALFGHKFVW
jgi:hypothetical protein